MKKYLKLVFITALFSFSLGVSAAEDVANWPKSYQTSEFTSRFLTTVAWLTPDTFYVGGSQGHILYTADGGKTWQAQTNPALNSWQWINSLCFKNSKQGFAIGYHGLLLKTNDGGRTWQAANSNQDIGCDWRSGSVDCRSEGRGLISAPKR